MPADLADSLKADECHRKTDYAPLDQVRANLVATVTAMVETNLLQGGAVVTEEVATETGTRESVVLGPDPIVFAPWSVLFGRGEPCLRQLSRHGTCCVFLLSHDLSQVHGKGDLGDEVDATPSSC